MLPGEECSSGLGRIPLPGKIRLVPPDCMCSCHQKLVAARCSKSGVGAATKGFQAVGPAASRRYGPAGALRTAGCLEYTKRHAKKRLAVVVCLVTTSSNLNRCIILHSTSQV